MKKVFVILTVLFCTLVNRTEACTTAIVSGKYTKDGRPLIFKHRDTGKLQNKIMFFDDGKYDYIGVVNSIDEEGKEVWMGTNSAGFCIMNSASYNLKPDTDTTKIMDREGFIMKKALQECETIEDFEKLLNEHPKPIGVEANFGVIDAFGGAAFYETDNCGFTKIDVNDPKNAPFGYVIRTNYSFTGTRDDGYGYIRYLTAEELLYTAEGTKNIDHRFFLQDVSRSLKHPLLNKDWHKEFPKDSNAPFYIVTQDYIPRYSSASTFLCEGVKNGEPAELTTMWTILGYQFCSVAIPTWVSSGPDLPKIVVANKKKVSPICDAALILKKKAYPITRGNGNSYLNLTSLVNKDGTGIYQKVKKIENKVLTKTKTNLDNWRENGFSKNMVLDFYNWIDKYISTQYKKEFELQLLD